MSTVYNDLETTLSQCSQQSFENIPNQQTIQKYDDELNRFPKDKYIAKLLNLASEREDYITWYRNALLSRALSMEGCPKGKLCARRTTSKSTSNQKYAEDCYRLSNFVNGNHAPLDDIFSKQRADDPNKQKIEIHKIDTAGLASTVHKLIERVTNLEQALILKEMDEVDLKVKIKCMQDTQQNLYAKISKLESQIEHQKTSLDSSETYAMVVANSPLGAPHSDMITPIKQVPADRSDHSSKTLSHSNVQVNNVNNKAQNQGHEGSSSSSIVNSKAQNRGHKGNTSSGNKERVQNKTNKIATGEKYENIKISKIPVIIGGQPEQEAQKETYEEDVFVGVTRKKGRYYLHGIGEKTTRSGLINYVEQNAHVSVTQLVFFQNKRKAYLKSAKLNVQGEDAYELQDDTFWPSGVKCRRWISSATWQQKIDSEYNTRYAFNDNDYNNNDKYKHHRYDNDYEDEGVSDWER